jgi:hypothetical protein
MAKESRSLRRTLHWHLAAVRHSPAVGRLYLKFLGTSRGHHQNGKGARESAFRSLGTDASHDWG